METNQELYEQRPSRKRREERNRELADIIEFVEFTNRFRSIERTIWFKGVEGRERNGEHTFQLSFTAKYVNHRCGLFLQDKLLTDYAEVHDLIETYAQDTPAHPDPERPNQPTHVDKEKRERAARKRISEEWGARYPAMVQAMWRYHAQSDEESRFVYALDKLVANLNIYCDEGRTNHKLGATLEWELGYKRPRMAKHPAIAELYEELVNRYSAQPDLFAPLQHAAE